MNDATSMALIGALLGALAAGGLIWWQSQRRLKEAALRVEHLEQARHQAVQHTSQARRQIEQLQKENGELRHLLARNGQAVPPPKAIAVEIPTSSDDDKAAGFAPTQLIQR